MSRPVQTARLPAVEIDTHDGTVRRGGTMVPAAVQHGGRFDGRITLHIAADIQAKGEYCAAILKGKQEAVARFLAQEFAIAAEVCGAAPGGNGNRVHLRGPEGVNTQGMFTLKIERVAMNPPLAGNGHLGNRPIARHVGEVHRRGGFTLLIKSPVGKQRRLYFRHTIKSACD
ncbi:MAG: hypothetical protein BWX80_03982 [Candidatus Hydrogenedentes bacterium ADurb.Bin101]|nr:MAG: hypothetical protein BWX80_03982 [Candidatus Hydrogenedentes bacterium ADurb.Bin101]